MKRLLFRILVSLLSWSSLGLAGEPRWDVLRVYTLADGRAVAVAYPGEWREVNSTRVLEAGAPAQFIDTSGRRVQIPADALVRAAETRTVARPQENRKVALRSR